MNHFASALQAIAAKNKVQQKDISRKKGLNSSHLSRLFNGHQTFVNDSDLKAIIDVVAKTQRERAQLIRAHMLDVCTGPGSELITVEIHGEPPKETPGLVASVPLTPEVQRAFEYLYRLIPKNHNVGPAIVGLAKMMGME